MPTYSLRGIEVQFPHEAYQCQVRKPSCTSTASCTDILAFDFCSLAHIYLNTLDDDALRSWTTWRQSSRPFKRYH